MNLVLFLIGGAVLIIASFFVAMLYVLQGAIGSTTPIGIVSWISMFLIAILAVLFIVTMFKRAGNEVK